jgi:hypothetical protein
VKKYFRVISLTLSVLVIIFFALNLTFVIRTDISTFRILMILGIVLSFFSALLSERGKWKKVSLFLSIMIGLFYFLVIELMRIVVQVNGL